MNAFQLLIKPVGPDCNLNCTYCFYHRVHRLFPDQPVHRMSREILEEMIRQYLALNFPTSQFSWQGGEPTLCGLSFFEEVVKLQMKHGKDGQMVGNSLQTNGLLLNEDWCRFLNEYKFFVGLSLDGPQSLHDYYRRQGDNGSWDGVMRAARLLSDYQVEFNILSVVTRKSEGQARELFGWFLEQGFQYLQFIPCLEKLPSGGITSSSVTAEGYGDFLCGLFDVWWESKDKKVSIRLFDNILEKLIYGTPTLCIFSPFCGGYLLIEHNGAVYPCDFFVKEDTCIGNIQKESLDKIFQSPAYKDFGRRKGMLPGECQKCRWLSLCRGGCQKDRLDSKGKPADKTLFCSSYKQLFSHALPRLTSLAEELKKESVRETGLIY